MTTPSSRIFVANGGLEGRELWITDGTDAGTRLLKDIAPGTSGSAITGLTRLDDGHYVFRADDGEHGAELWVTDGTAAGTKMLKDIAAGATGSVPGEFAATGAGQVVFTANDGAHGVELWVTDGTSTGTRLLWDIRPGADGSLPGGLTAAGNGQVLFQANNGSGGVELWTTDGTAAGTRLVKDIHAGAGGAYPLELTALGNGLSVFRASDDGVEPGLWVTDGTGAGTRRLSQGEGLPEAAWPSHLTALGNGLALFTATDAVHGSELWITDGTAAGTRRVLDTVAGAAGADIQSLTALGDGRALYRANDGVHGVELWVTDGTAAGTHLVKDGVAGANSSAPGQITALGNGLAVFRAAGGVQNDKNFGDGKLRVIPSDFELWVTDGSEAGTRRLKDIMPGAGSANITGLRAQGDGTALFQADDGVHGAELWVTDGTEAGTRLVKDVNTGTESGDVNRSWITDSASAKAFQALGGWQELGNGLSMTTTSTLNNGLDYTRLWVSDGTVAGTQKYMTIQEKVEGLLDLGSGQILFWTNNGLWVTDGTAVGTRWLNYGVQVESPYVTSVRPLGNGSALFAGRSIGGGQHGLCITDGTVDGTQWLANMPPRLNSVKQLGDGWVLTGYRSGSAKPYELWVTDGSATGTQLLMQTASWGSMEVVGQAKVSDGRIAFLTRSSSEPLTFNELWVTDGTTNGTQKLHDHVCPKSLATVGDHILFAVKPDNPDSPVQVWISDGTVTGSQLFREVAQQPGGFTSFSMKSLSDGLAVFGNDSLTIINNSELGNVIYPARKWLTDGTIEGTREFPGAVFETLRIENGSLLFRVTGDPSQPDQLWLSDGTVAGTVFVRNMVRREGDSLFSDQVRLTDGRMLFSLNDGEHGSELWVTDGSLTGTRLLKDLTPGAEGSTVMDMTALGDGRYMFSAFKGDTAVQSLWITDGTEAGTHWIRDISIGAAEDFPGDRLLVVEGAGKVLFAGNDGVHGSELWISDGTSAGTHLVRDILTGAAGSGPYHFRRLADGRAVFLADDGIHGAEQWSTDGTATGTRLIKDGNLRSQDSSPEQFFPIIPGTPPLVSSPVPVADLETDITPPAIPVATNVAVYAGDSSDYQFNVDGEGRLSATDNTGGASAALSGINVLKFADRTWTWTVGQEVRINSFTGITGMVTLADESYVLINGSSLQRFDIAGAPQGEMIRVEGSRIYALPDGGFVTTLSGGQVQFFDNSAIKTVPVLSVLPLNHLSNSLVESILVPLDDGSALVVWSESVLRHDGRWDWNVYSQRVSVDGIPLGDFIQVNETPVVDYYERPKVQAIKLSDGSAVVTWTTESRYGKAALYGRKIEAGSLEPGEQFRVGSVAVLRSSDDVQSMVALADGGFVVRWNVFDQDRIDTVAQRFDQQCQPEGAAFVIANDTSWTNGFKMTTLANGDLLAVWSEQPSTTFTFIGGITTVTGKGDYDIFACRFDASGHILSEKFRVNTTLIDEQERPVVKSLPDGGFIIAWQSGQRNSSSVYSQRFDANGNAVTAGAPQASVLGSGLADFMDFSGSAIPLTLSGGTGDDTYVLGNANIGIYEFDNGGGTDTVQAAFSYALGYNLENLMLTGTANIDGTGNYLANVLTGNSGANTLIGGWGNDTYILTDAGDTINEYFDEGVDTVLSAGSYTLGNNLESLTLTGFANINGNGNILNNTMTGNRADNILDGGGGADTVILMGTPSDYRFGQGTANRMSVMDTQPVNGEEGTDTLIGIETLQFSDRHWKVTMGGGFQINTTATGDQQLPSKTSLPDGGYVVVWKSDGQDGNGSAIYGQRYTSAGVALGNEFQVNSSPVFAYTPPIISSLSNGGFVVAWVGYSLDDYSEVIIGQCFSDTGVALGSEFRVTPPGYTGYDYNSLTPTISSQPDGGFVIVWSEEEMDSFSSSYDTLIYGQRYTNDGVALDPKFLVGGGMNFTVESPSISFLRDGGFVVTWAASRDGEWGIYGRRYTREGVASGLEFSVGATSELYQVDPSITTLSDGGFVVTWKYMVQDGVNGGSWATRGQRFNADGSTAGSSRIEGSALGDEMDFSDSTAGIVLIGGDGDDHVQGGAGDDEFEGGLGNDTLHGGLGNDTYILTDASDTIVEVADEGTDTVHAAFHYTLGAPLENLLLTGAAALNGTGNTQSNILTGNSGANTLSGLAGNDRLDGGAGIDRLIGGLGNDTYVVDASGDLTLEQAAEGTDRVESAIGWTLGANLEQLTLTGTAAINGYGNSLDNLLTGNTAGNTLNGRAGADTMAGGLGDDRYYVDQSGDVVMELSGEGEDFVYSTTTAYTLSAHLERLYLVEGSAALGGTGNAGDNRLSGNSAANTLNGGDGQDLLTALAGHDRLDGGGGADKMYGGLGDDTFIVDHIGDSVVEETGEGSDTVWSSVSLTLKSNVEQLLLTGVAHLNGIGNALDNQLTGNSGDNRLEGGLGNDRLTGGLGADTLIGGGGDDRYYVDNAGDRVLETAGNGDDYVYSTVDYTLGAELERLYLQPGSAARLAIGNDRNNLLSGNSLANTLQGGLGDDLMVGGLGNDTYRHARGDHADTVKDVDATAGNTDVLEFLNGITHDQLWFRHAGSDLVINLLGSSEKVSVQGWYDSPDNRVEVIRTGDDHKTLTADKVEALVSAMAGMSLPTTTTLSVAQHVALDAVIAASWS